MPSSKHIILVGSSELVNEFKPLLLHFGLQVTEVSKIGLALEKVQKVRPDAVVFMLPRYWDDVTTFVENVREDSAFANLPIVYVGSLIEGEDQRILHEKGVKTLTLGPLPPAEVVRYIVDMLNDIN